MVLNIKKLLNLLNSNSNKHVIMQRRIEETEKIRQLENDIERVQNLIVNCDQKSSITLATIGVLISIFLSTGAVINKIITLPNKIILFVNNRAYLQLIAYSISLFILIAALILIGASLFCLLKSIKSKIDISDYSDAICSNNHKTFFGSINAITYNTFKEERLRTTNNERIEELISQLYINSKICNSKFNSYNNGLNLFIYGLLLIYIDIFLLFLI